MNPVDKNYLPGNRNQKTILICEAVDCYEAATEAILVYVGKFGAINLNLCHKCAVTKFQTAAETVQTCGSLRGRSEDVIQ